jgi:acetaldehyde dehydrogenase (acetylating)
MAKAKGNKIKVTKGAPRTAAMPALNHDFHAGSVRVGMRTSGGSKTLPINHTIKALSTATSQPTLRDFSSICFIISLLAGDDGNL